MLGDGGQEVGGGEDLEVAVDLGIEPGAVDDHVRGPFQGHLLNGERVAQDVFLKCHLTKKDSIERSAPRMSECKQDVTARSLNAIGQRKLDFTGC